MNRMGYTHVECSDPQITKPASLPRSSVRGRRKTSARVYKRAAVKTEPANIKPQPQNAQGSATKQETVLTLLSRADGVSIPEMMLATQWQQHSVRGFLAGTVKKKLGFQLTSIKAAGDDRRYRIEARRAR
jgi:hypothetical protein